MTTELTASVWIEAPSLYMRSLSDLLEEFARRHKHLCPRQVLGARMGLLGARFELTVSLEKLLSKPSRKAICAACGEEIINEREVVRDGRTLCRACAGDSYWHGV